MDWAAQTVWEAGFPCKEIVRRIGASRIPGHAAFYQRFWEEYQANSLAEKLGIFRAVPAVVEAARGRPTAASSPSSARCGGRGSWH